MNDFAGIMDDLKCLRESSLSFNAKVKLLSLMILLDVLQTSVYNVIHTPVRSA